MDKLKNIIKSWASILVPLFVYSQALAGYSIFLPATTRDRERYRRILEDFLQPFDGILTQTRKIFNELRDDLELARLESHQSRLQDYFTSLPEGDSRKLLWKSHIEQLQDLNRRAVDLIKNNYGRITLAHFRKACDKFIYHVGEWDDLWRTVEGSGTISASQDVPGKLYADPFPAELEPALRAELSEIRRSVSPR